MRGHWHTDNPLKGSAYRSLSVINGKPDNALLDAAELAAIANLGFYFPSNITFWVDPGCVSFRIGDCGSVSNIWVDETSVFSSNYANSDSWSMSDSPQQVSAKMALAAALPPSPPQLSRQQLRQLKIQQKQTELQEMARSLSNQYSMYNAHYPTLVNSPPANSVNMNISAPNTSSTISISIASPPSLSSMGRQKSAPTSNSHSSSSSKKYQAQQPHNDSMYNVSGPSNNNFNNSSMSPPQSRRTKSYNSHNKKHNNNSNNINSQPTSSTTPHIPGLAFKEPSHKSSRGGSSRGGHKSKGYHYAAAIMA
ncbi:hypothetical protein BDR26DRAFT_856319 [Obelidium mucronatum]|nr:hypothetical protein BDR26DRAFT_856319 [Obelidium mucronatum]